MATVVDAEQTELICQSTGLLFGPDHMALGEAVDKQDRFPVGLPIFMHSKLEATTTSDRVNRHVSSSATLGCGDFDV